MERDADNFDIDDDFVPPSEEASDYDQLVDRTERRSRAANPATPIKKGPAAWSKLEDVLAEKRLLKALQEYDEDN
ncbi:MAG: hypothetical protein AB7F79_07095 [Steroidobacteraceae bacterium]